MSKKNSSPAQSGEKVLFPLTAKGGEAKSEWTFDESQLASLNWKPKKLGILKSTTGLRIGGGANPDREEENDKATNRNVFKLQLKMEDHH